MAILLSAIETERCECCDSVIHGGRRVAYRVCHAGIVNYVNNNADAFNISDGHFVEVPIDATDDDLRSWGWRQCGRAWVCPGHCDLDRKMLESAS